MAREEAALKILVAYGVRSSSACCSKEAGRCGHKTITVSDNFNHIEVPSALFYHF